MRVGPYEIEGSIGSGATGTVFRARDARGGLVAVKVLNKLSAAAVARFERERRLHDSLGAQDGFVPLLDAGGGPHGPWLAMPFIPGGTLRQRLAQGRSSIEDSVRIATRLARALARAHALGIVHRDMKPENVLFTAEGEPLIADIGLAKHFEGDALRTAALSQTGELRGTAGYAPLEQMNDAKAVGPQADVFAVGAMLYELLAGTPAFMAPSLVELLAKVEEGDFPDLDTARPGTPPWLVRIVERCLRPDPKARFADGGALAAALVARGRDEPKPQPSRIPAPIAASLVFLVAALALLGFALHRSGQPPAPIPPAPSLDPVPGVPGVPPPPAPPDASVANAPDWYRALEPAARPRRLPTGIKFGAKPGEYVNEKDESVLVHVPGGRFKVGSQVRDAAPFFIGKYEVTNYQFASFVTAAGFRTQAEQARGGHVIVESTHGREEGAYWKFPRGQGALEVPAPARHPVVQIWWRDAVAYVAWAGLRLPTTDEWQKAAGWDPATSRERTYPWGEESPATASRPLGNLADQSFLKKWLEPPAKSGPYEDGFERIAPVDTFPQSACAYGAFEMGGNVSEWTTNAYDRKRNQKVEEPVIDRFAGTYYTICGGSFGDYPPANACKVTAEPKQPKLPKESFGIRVCRSEE